jgi:hypothetical protein
MSGRRPVKFALVIGPALGHGARLRPVADALVQKGAQVEFLTPRLDPRTAISLADHKVHILAEGEEREGIPVGISVTLLCAMLYAVAAMMQLSSISTPYAGLPYGEVFPFLRPM